MSSRLLRPAAVAVTLALLPATASARYCTEMAVHDAKNLRSGLVKNDAGPRLYFQRSAAPCPGGADCRATAYLVPGDRVFLADEKGPYVCAMFRGKKRDTAGWLPRAGLDIDATPAPPAREDWLGRWRSAENVILVDPKEGGKLFFKGWAFTPPYYLSDFDVETVPKGNQVTYKFAGCTIKLRWLAGFILANNTSDCTGTGNSFYGIYTRTALTTDPADETPEAAAAGKR